MKIQIIPINCGDYGPTRMPQVFQVVKYNFDFISNVEDKTIRDTIISNAEVLAKKVNVGAASQANLLRTNERIVNNSIAGLLAEYIWLDFLNRNGKRAESVEYSGSYHQIDIKLVDSQKTIEVRSSFPRNGLPFALCHYKYEFDVIGPYSNGYKPSEIQKDFYVRALYPFSSFLLREKLIQNNFEVFLVGGATWHMMTDDSKALEKTFIPEDELSVERLMIKTNYRVVPFSKALDTLTIIKSM